MTDREAFIDAKVAENHYQPPYFEMMERLNTEGGAPTDRYLTPPPISPDSELFKGEAQIVDIRSETDFAAAHVPGSYCIPASMLASFSGWFLDYDRDIVLVSDSAAQAQEAATTLARLGYDRVVGHHAGTVPMATSNQPLESTDLIDTDEVKARLSDRPSGWTLLDVRSIDEFKGGHIEGAEHAYAGRIPVDLPDLDRSGPITVMCGSGMRASIAASVLRREGFEKVDVYYGSWKAWNSQG